jgi:hypothetical protein
MIRATGRLHEELRLSPRAVRVPGFLQPVSVADADAERLDRAPGHDFTQRRLNVINRALTVREGGGRMRIHASPEAAAAAGEGVLG